MLNLKRYTYLYWTSHQWDLNSKTTYNFHSYYRKLNLLWAPNVYILTESNPKRVPKRSFLKRSKPSITKRKYNYLKPLLIKLQRNPLSKFIVSLTKGQLYKVNINLNTYRVGNKSKLFVNSKRYFCLRDLTPTNNYRLRFNFKQLDYKSRTWFIGLHKLSFYTKKTITFEKNRKVRKAKVFLQFSRMYNFFKNIINVFYKKHYIIKKHLYMFFLKKTYRFTIGFVLKTLSGRLLYQKKKPLVLNVQHRK